MILSPARKQSHSHFIFSQIEEERNLAIVKFTAVYLFKLNEQDSHSFSYHFQLELDGLPYFLRLLFTNDLKLQHRETRYLPSESAN